MELNMENIVIAIASAYVAIRGGQELYRIVQEHFIQDYLLLNDARKYKKIPEVYHYHLFQLAQKLLQEEKPKKAEKYFEMILKNDPDYPLANYLLGIVCLQQYQPHKAIIHLERDKRNYPEHPLIRFFLAKALFYIEKFTEAQQELDKSLELNPYYYPGYLFAFDLYQHLHAEPRVEWEFYHRAEKAKCLIKPIWLRMAELEQSFLSPEEQEKRMKFYESLDEAWVESTKIKEKVMKALANKQFYQAENLLIEGLHANPHDNQLYQMYDQLLILQRKFPSALSFYRDELQRINPNPLEATLRLSDYYVYNKDYQTALEIMLQVFHKYSNAKFLHYPLCILHNWLNEREQALAHLAKAIYFDRGIKKLALNNPELEDLRQDSEFQELVQKK